jgi:hypothetical protein
MVGRPGKMVRGDVGCWDKMAGCFGGVEVAGYFG